MATKRCKACGKTFVPWPQVPHQKFCSDPICQRGRRRRSQTARRANNPDQKSMDAQYLQDWAAKHPDYWKTYRATHPEYVVRNREQQKLRNLTRIAKEAVWPREALSGGRFRLQRLNASGIAKEAACLVELFVLQATCSL